MRQPTWTRTQGGSDATPNYVGSVDQEAQNGRRRLLAGFSSRPNTEMRLTAQNTGPLCKIKIGRDAKTRHGSRKGASGDLETQSGARHNKRHSHRSGNNNTAAVDEA